VRAEGLYAVAATDLHGPTDAREWVGEALAELQALAGDTGLVSLLREGPRRVLAGEPVEMVRGGGVEGGTS